MGMFVLDEADEMLSKGFKDGIYDIFRELPGEIQVILLSATMPDEDLDVTKRFMRNPATILVERDESLTIVQAVIFTNTRRKVDWLTDRMKAKEFVVSAMHDDMEQKERNVIMTEFRSGSSRVLIT